MSGQPQQPVRHGDRMAERSEHVAAESQGIDQPQRIPQLATWRQRAGRLGNEHRLPAAEIEQHKGFAEFVFADDKHDQAERLALA